MKVLGNNPAHSALRVSGATCFRVGDDVRSLHSVQPIPVRGSASPVPSASFGVAKPAPSVLPLPFPPPETTLSSPTSRFPSARGVPSERKMVSRPVRRPFSARKCLPDTPEPQFSTCRPPSSPPKPLRQPRRPPFCRPKPAFPTCFAPYFIHNPHNQSYLATKWRTAHKSPTEH